MTATVEEKHLLTSGDPVPYEIVNPESTCPVLLVCEHAGQTIPQALGDLGLPAGEIDKHIGWDIGAAAVTRHLAEYLDASAILQRYTRLVIDCNRPPNTADSAPESSDYVVVPANVNLSAEDHKARVNEIFEPFHAQIEKFFVGRRPRIAISIHSFTKILCGYERPWDVGLLYRHDSNSSEHLRNHIQNLHPELNIGMNQPYQIDDVSDWFVPRHGEARGISHSLIEVRNDLVGSEAGQKRWAGIFAGAIQSLTKVTLE